MSTEEKLTSCLKCKKTFSSKKNLNVHIRKFHNEEKIRVRCNNITCGICKETFTKMWQLYNHLESIHNICLNYINETFYSKDEFMAWKSKIEKESRSSFVFKSFNHNEGTGKTTNIFICHRSGPSKIKRNGSKKMPESVKTGCTCPAGIKAIMQTVNEITEIHVNYQSVHAGHDFEVQKLRLPREERRKIASAICLGVPFKLILDEARKLYVPGERCALVTRKDLYNISRDFQIEKDIPTSLDVIVGKMHNNIYDPVLVYKPLDYVISEYPSIEAHEILLGIMTEQQHKLLELYGSSGIMIDSTEETKIYNFKVTTVLLCNPINSKFLPVATLFSSRISQEILISFFLGIKKTLPNLKTNVVLTSDTFYHAWKIVFNDQSKHLLCTEQVYEDWISNIESRVKDAKNKENMKIQLKDILMESDIHTFEELMTIFIESYKNDEQDFIQYFTSNYENSSVKWAYCHRLFLGLGSYTKLERWHQQLNYEETDGTVRLVKAIKEILNAIALCLLTTVMILEVKNLSIVAEFTAERHVTSKRMAKDYDLLSYDDNEFLITKPESPVSSYSVKKINLACKCPIKCHECNVCIHSFSCTCMDYSIRFLICKHIHFVCQHLKQNLCEGSQSSEDILPKKNTCTICFIKPKEPGDLPNEGEDNSFAVYTEDIIDIVDVKNISVNAEENANTDENMDIAIAEKDKNIAAEEAVQNKMQKRYALIVKLEKHVTDDVEKKKKSLLNKLNHLQSKIQELNSMDQINHVEAVCKHAIIAANAYLDKL